MTFLWFSIFLVLKNKLVANQFFAFRGLFEEGLVFAPYVYQICFKFYHPSNAGSWTRSLEQLLRFLFAYFLGRLAKEQR